MDIIVTGYGKAGAFHENAYLELKAENIFTGRLFFIDIKFNGDSSKEKMMYGSIEDLMAEHPLDTENTIIDICLPIGVMIHTIQHFKSYGFFNYICEKPFVFYKEPDINAKEALKDIKLYVVENYLYSQITRFAKDMILKYELKARIVTSEFSKDRRNDSFCNRGFSSEESILSVFEVEVPHQVYMCEHLFGKIDSILYKQCEDMNFHNKCMKDHGKGMVICTNKDGCIYLISSNLETDMRRNIHIICHDQYIMELYFSPVMINDQIFNYSVFLYKEEKLIEWKSVERDNNMYEMLKDYYLSFLGKRNKKFATYKDVVVTSKLFEAIKEDVCYLQA